MGVPIALILVQKASILRVSIYHIRLIRFLASRHLYRGELSILSVLLQIKILFAYYFFDSLTNTIWSFDYTLPLPSSNELDFLAPPASLYIILILSWSVYAGA